ncbi:MAG TPA: hypothetical protein PLA74_07895 [Syntrophales bacterium]|nr:hypothetical protein [Syntrophales bacterium]
MTLKADILTDLDSVFFSNDEFSEDFTFTPTGLTARTIKGIFDAPYQAVSPESGEIETTAPSILVMTSDVSGVVHHGDAMTRVSDSVNYEVVGIQPDTAGTTRLIMSRETE